MISKLNKATFFGINPPWFGGAQNVLSRQEDERLIKNDILQLLMTVPGERVMRPNFGVPLRSFVFEPFNDNDLSVLESTIKSSIEAQDSRVLVSRVTIDRDDDRNGISIVVVATIVKNPTKEITVEQFLLLRS